MAVFIGNTSVAGLKRGAADAGAYLGSSEIKGAGVPPEPVVPGPISIPAGFDWVSGINFTRAVDGTISSDFNIDAARPAAGKTYYVSASRADNTGDGLSWATAKRDLSVALLLSDWDTVLIDETTGPYYGTKGWRGAAVTRGGVISTRYGGKADIINIDATTPPVWSLNSGNCYQTPLAIANDAVCTYDRAVDDTYGFPTRLTRRTSIQEVIDNPGSDFYVAGSPGTLYVHAANSRNLVGDQNILPSDSSNNGNWQPTTSAVLWMENLRFIAGSRAFRGLCQTVGARPKLYHKNCEFIGGANSNNFALQGAFEVYGVGHRCAGAAQDGMNYHWDTTGGQVAPKVYEQNGDVGLNGFDTGGANNASTVHEASRVIRVNTNYRTAQNRTIHDIGASQAWLLGCNIGASQGSGDAAGVKTNDTTQIWLDHCTIAHNPNSTFDIDATGGPIRYRAMTIEGLTTNGQISAY